jgi:L-Ala-D/L-Glu epimerase
MHTVPFKGLIQLRITKIEATAVRIPIHPMVDAYGSYPNEEFILVKVETDEGVLGYGEAPCSPSMQFYGETLETTMTSITLNIAPRLIREDPMNIGKLTSLMDATQGNAFLAKTGLDIALYDLIGKALKTRLGTILGGIRREEVKIGMEVVASEPDEVVKEAQKSVEMGIRVIKIHCWRDVEREMDTLMKVRNAVGSDVVLKLDPNGTWTRESTLKAAKTMSRCELEYIEQPLPGWDLKGLAWVRRTGGDSNHGR